MFNPLYQYRFKIGLALLLVAASVISLVLEKAHTAINGEETYGFLVLNLKLAWIPFIAAVAVNWTTRSRALFFLLMPICTVVWIVFFPNAPYLLTDFQHLAAGGGDSPLWFDVIVLLWFAWTGLLLGIASLFLMQEIVTHRSSAAMGWVFAIGATAASSIGVYLGRFLRWNSWDLLIDPIPIARDMVGIMRHPIANLPTYGFTILFTLLFLFIYLTIHLFGRAMRGTREPAQAAAPLHKAVGEEAGEG